ncbi:MAG: 5'-methylthioadenosine/S-adenosylhomocysteine nucleosidase [Oligoflexia bacterium]|nr:5'-methylthioadenosine/S-adenosylhomocysteine nucleosidase [Oligoflexia bacterium]
MTKESIKTKRILILTAMDVEAAAIFSAFGSKKLVPCSIDLGIDAFLLSSDNVEYWLANMGIGLGSAAITVAILAAKIKPHAIIQLGVAGAVSPSLEIGDAVLATSIIQHDSFFSGENDRELMAPGALYLSTPKEQRENPEFRCSEKLLALFRKNIAPALSIPVHEGLLLSGSEFVGSFASKKALSDRFSKALAVEMESASVAMVARRMSIPTLAVKTIADRLRPDKTIAHDYGRFLDLAAKNAASIAQRLVHLDAASFEGP